MEYLLIIAALCSNNILDFNLSVNTKVACIQRMSACYEKELKKEVGQALLSPLSPEARAMNSCIYQKEMLSQSSTSTKSSWRLATIHQDLYLAKNEQVLIPLMVYENFRINHQSFKKGDVIQGLGKIVGDKLEVTLLNASAQVLSADGSLGIKGQWRDSKQNYLKGAFIVSYFSPILTNLTGPQKNILPFLPTLQPRVAPSRTFYAENFYVPKNLPVLLKTP